MRNRIGPAPAYQVCAWNGIGGQRLDRLVGHLVDDELDATRVADARLREDDLVDARRVEGLAERPAPGIQAGRERVDRGMQPLIHAAPDLGLVLLAVDDDLRADVDVLVADPVARGTSCRAVGARRARLHPFQGERRLEADELLRGHGPDGRLIGLSALRRGLAGQARHEEDLDRARRGIGPQLRLGRRPSRATTAPDARSATSSKSRAVTARLRVCSS